MFLLSRGNRFHPRPTFQKRTKLSSILPLLLISTATRTTTNINQVQAMSTTSANSKPAALIFLHGLGDTPAGWSSLEDQLPSIQPSLSNLQYVFPAAPTIPITINGGMTMPGWFDLFDWPIGVGVKDDHEGLKKAVDVVENHVSDLEKKGISRDRIVIGGFSQGGAVALRSVYDGSISADGNTCKGPFAGCVSLSGWLTFQNVADGGKGVPLFLAHGSHDDKVLFEQQKHAEVILSEQGVNHVDSRSYSMGHSSHPQEMVDMARFLDDILFKSE